MGHATRKPGTSLPLRAFSFPLTSFGLSALCFSFFLSFFFFNLASPHSLWDLSSPTRDQTQAPAVKALSPNHRTTREFPALCFSFPSQCIPPTSPLSSFILIPSLSFSLSLSFSSEKASLTYGAAIILLLQSKGRLNCSALTINSDLDVKGEDERTEEEKTELGPEFSPHGALGRARKVIPLAPEMKPACHSWWRK